MASKSKINGRMKWHIPRYIQRPGTLMRLGSILTEPDELESSLNVWDGIESFPEKATMDQSTGVQQVVKTYLGREVGGGASVTLPATMAPLASAGGGFGLEASSELDVTIKALGVRAKIMIPAAAEKYMNRALGLPAVEARLRKTLFEKTLYMVVGVATCKKLVICEAMSRRFGIGLEAHANLAASSVEGSISTNLDRESSHGTELTVDEECDFAYRVRKFRYYRFTKSAYMRGDETGGALFGADDDGYGCDEDPLASQGAEFDRFVDTDEDLIVEKKIVAQLPPMDELVDEDGYGVDDDDSDSDYY